MRLRPGGIVVLNPGSPSSHQAGAGLATALQQAALGLKAAYYRPEWNGFDYEAARISREFDAFAELARELHTLSPEGLGETGERLAFWINLYNALTIHAVIALRPRWTVWSVPGFFRRAAYEVGGCRFSLEEIEHGVLRANRPAALAWKPPFRPGDPRLSFALTGAEFDPRVHFALNCGSRSCPPIAFFTPDGIDAQLDLAARAFLTAETEIVGARVVTTPILAWYRRDFSPSPVEFLKRHLPADTATRVDGKRLSFRRYDWRLNDRRG